MTGTIGLLVLLLFGSTKQPADKIIAGSSPDIKYMGRTITVGDAVELCWPASSATITFKGTKLSATLKERAGASYFLVIIDGDSTVRMKLDTAKKVYTLADNLPPGRHTVQLFKRTEFGKTLFYNFRLSEGSAVIKPDTHKPKTMEFYGNSITCGRSVEDYAGKDSGAPEYENTYMSYASIVARHYHANYNLVAKSSIGLMVSWFPFTMRDMYNRADPMDSTQKWDFKKFTPDVVVINLFQNDSWIVKLPENKEFKRVFGATPPSEDFIVASYKSFVATIRGKYPKAWIICTLGSMNATQRGSPWPGYIEKAVQQTNDPKVLAYFYPYKGTPIHPAKQEHEDMANQLIGFIDKNVKW